MYYSIIHFSDMQHTWYFIYGGMMLDNDKANIDKNNGKSIRMLIVCKERHHFLDTLILLPVFYLSSRSVRTESDHSETTKCTTLKQEQRL